MYFRSVQWQNIFYLFADCRSGAYGPGCTQVFSCLNLLQLYGWCSYSEEQEDSLLVFTFGKCSPNISVFVFSDKGKDSSFSGAIFSLFFIVFLIIYALAAGVCNSFVFVVHNYSLETCIIIVAIYFENTMYQVCGHCKQGTTCDRVTGVCPNGCQAGYTNDHCKLSLQLPAYLHVCRQFSQR